MIHSMMRVYACMSKSMCVSAQGKYLDSKVHVAHMGLTWVLSAPDGPHVGPMNLAIRVYVKMNTW